MNSTPPDLAGLSPHYPLRPEWEWTPAQTAGALKNRRVSLVDCRRAPELAVAQIAGATWIPMDETPARLDEFRAMPQPLVILCHHGVRSLRVAAFLRENGVEAWSMAGGIDAWSLGVDAGTARY